MFYLTIFDNIAFSIWQAIRSFIGVINGALYGYIVDLYNVFMIIARIDILDSEYVQLIYNRVGMFLGIFMLFKLSFALLQSFIDPNKFSDKKNGFSSVIGRCVISIVLLGITPALFKYSRKLQNIIVGTENDSNNILYRVIVADDIIYPVSTFGQTLATDLYFSFFRPDPDTSYVAGITVDDFDENPVVVIEDYGYLKEKSYKGDSDTFTKLAPYLSLRDGGKYVFKWDIILSVGVAIAVLWILVNYCISIAIRVIQLAYLQLVSPIPILSYIGDPEGSFKKWVNQCITTYVDLFIRLSILYFIITLSGRVLDLLNSAKFKATYGLEEGSGYYTLVKVFILIALLLFGKRVPELLKELFPGNGKFDFGVKSPKKLFSEIPGLNAASGMALGAAGGVVGGAAHGLVNMKKNWQDNKGQGGKRLGKTLGAGFKGAGSSAIRGVTGGLKGVSNKGGLGGAFKTGMQNFKEPIKGDIESWKEHKKYWVDDQKKINEINQGRKMYDRYGEDNLAQAFGNREYAMTYNAKKAASDAKDKATAALEAARSELNAAYNSGDKNIIAAANAKYLSTQKAYDSAVKAYERSEEAHKLSQSKYEGDKKIEDMLKAYKNSDAYRIAKEKNNNPNDDLRDAAINAYKDSDTYKSLIEQPETSSEELLKSFKSSPEYVDYVNNISGGSVFEAFKNSDTYKDLERNNATEEEVRDAFMSSDEFKEFADKLDTDGGTLFDFSFDSSPNADDVDVSSLNARNFGVFPSATYDGEVIRPDMPDFAKTLEDENNVNINDNSALADSTIEEINREKADASSLNVNTKIGSNNFTPEQLNYLAQMVLQTPDKDEAIRYLTAKGFSESDAKKFMTLVKNKRK